MRIFNEDKTQEIQEYDESMYHLQPDKLLVAHHEATPEIQKQSHYVVVAEYDNGGKDVEEVIDVPYQPAVEAYDEYEDIYVLVPFTQKELDDNEIAELKQNLANTDYQAIKFAEGVLSLEDYAPVKAQRQTWRARINELEKEPLQNA